MELAEKEMMALRAGVRSNTARSAPIPFCSVTPCPFPFSVLDSHVLAVRRAPGIARECPCLSADYEIASEPLLGTGDDGACTMSLALTHGRARRANPEPA